MNKLLVLTVDLKYRGFFFFLVYHKGHVVVTHLLYKE